MSKTITRAVQKLVQLYGGIHYQRFSRDLNTLLICQGLGRVIGAILQARGSKSGRIRTALVGYHPSILRHTEPLSDCGFDISFFAGRADDIMHPSRPLSELAAVDFDCVLVADDTAEAHLCDALCAKGIWPVRIMPLVDAHISMLKAMRFRGVSTCLNPYKQAVITAVLALADPVGIVVECGVYMGGTTIQMALLQRFLGLKRPIFALDTYEGMPEPTAADFGGGFVYKSGMFTGNRRDLVKSFYQKAGVDADIEIVPGLCQDTLPAIIHRNPNVAFAFLDTDQYAGTKGGLDVIAPLLKNDAMIVIDDTTVHGVDRAIREALEHDSGLVRVSVLMNFDFVLRR